MVCASRASLVTWSERYTQRDGGASVVACSSPLSNLYGITSYDNKVRKEITGETQAALQECSHGAAGGITRVPSVRRNILGIIAWHCMAVFYSISRGDISSVRIWKGAQYDATGVFWGALWPRATFSYGLLRLSH